MDNALFAELDLAVRRGNFEKAEQMIEGFKNRFVPDTEEYGELCYYELLTHYKATSIYELHHWFIATGRSTSNCKFCSAVIYYSDSRRKAQVMAIDIKAGKFRGISHYLLSFKEAAQRYLQEKNYPDAIRNFLIANEKSLAIDTALTASGAALKKNDFDLAQKCLDDTLFDDACYAQYEKVKKYRHIYAKFQKEIGSPKKYAVNALEAADREKYRQYLRLSNRSGGYTDGVLHFIAVLVALVVSVFMLFDPQLDVPALYVIWGICASVALHKKYFWDFGIIKSIGGTFLLCLIPVMLTAFSDEVLDADGLGAIITIAVTLIEFIPTLIRNIKYMNNSKAGKKTVALRTQFIEPTLGKARRQLVEKYAPLTDRETATAWANTIKL